MDQEVLVLLGRLVKASEEMAAHSRESIELHRKHQALSEQSETARQEYEAFQREEAAKSEAHDKRTYTMMAEVSETMKREAAAVEERFKVAEASAERRFREWEARLLEVERNVPRGQPS